MIQQRQVPGLKCPRCGQFIETTIQQLLSQPGLTCPHCRLELKINRQESRRAMEILGNVDRAARNLENASKFNR